MGRDPNGTLVDALLGDQVFVDQMTADVVAVTRHCPVSHQSVVLVAHTAFTKPDHGADQGPLRDLVVEGCLQEVLFEAHVAHKDAAYVGSFFFRGRIRVR